MSVFISLNGVKIFWNFGVCYSCINFFIFVVINFLLGLNFNVFIGFLNEKWCNICCVCRFIRIFCLFLFIFNNNVLFGDIFMWFMFLLFLYCNVVDFDFCKFVIDMWFLIGDRSSIFFLNVILFFWYGVFSRLLNWKFMVFF